MVEFYSAVNTIEFGQEYFKYFTLIHSRILSAQSQYYFGINDFERFVFSIDSMQKKFQKLLKISYFRLLIVLLRTFDFEYVRFVLFVFHSLQFWGRKAVDCLCKWFKFSSSFGL